MLGVPVRDQSSMQNVDRGKYLTLKKHTYLFLMDGVSGWYLQMNAPGTGHRIYSNNADTPEELVEDAYDWLLASLIFCAEEIEFSRHD